MAIILKLDYEDMSAYLAADSITYSKQQSGRGTASFVLNFSSHVDLTGAQVEIWDGTSCDWAGVIKTADERAKIGGTCPDIEVSVTCVSREALIDQRVIEAETYGPTAVAGDVIRDLITKYFAADGIQAGSIGGGAAVPNYAIDHVTGADVLNDLCQRSGAIWEVMPDRSLNFRLPSGTMAAFAVSDSHPFATSVKTSVDDLDYANEIFRKIAPEAVTPISETFTGDGATHSWDLTKKAGSIVSMTLDGNSVDYGITGIDTGKAFYWIPGTTTITDAGGAAITGSLVVQYREFGAAVVYSKNQSAITARAAREVTSGRHAKIVDGGDTDAALAQSANDAEVALTSVTPLVVEIQTQDVKPIPGTVVNIVLTTPAVNGDYIIQDVTAQEVQGAFQYTYHAADVTRIPKWQDYFKKSGTVGPTSTGGGGGVTVTYGAPTKIAGNVAITAITVSACISKEPAPTSPGGIQWPAKRGRNVDITYDHSGAGVAFRGVYVQIEEPDQSIAEPAELAGDTPLDDTRHLGGPFKPFMFGPFDEAQADGHVQVFIPEPAQTLPVTCRARLISYSDNITNEAAGSPSAQFVVSEETANKPQAATANCENPTYAVVHSVTRDSSGAVDKTIIDLRITPPSDPRYAGCVPTMYTSTGVLVGTSPDVVRGIQYTWIIDTPNWVDTVVIYVPGCDGANTNPVVEMITPYATCTIGTTAGTVDLGRARSTSLASVLEVKSGVLGVKASSLTSDLIADQAISTQKLVDQAVGANQIAPFAVTAAKIGNAAIQNAHLDRASAYKIAITDADIVNLAAGKITAGTLAAGVLYGGKIYADQLDVRNGVKISGTALIDSLYVTQLLVGPGGQKIPQALIANIDCTIINWVSAVGASLDLVSGNQRIRLDPSNCLTISDSSANLQAVIRQSGLTITDTANPLGHYASLSVDYLNIQTTVGRVQLGPGTFKVSALPWSNPGAGTKLFWYDPADGNRVKFAA